MRRALALPNHGVDADLLKASHRRRMRRFGRINAADIEETRAHVHLVLERYWALLRRSQPARAQRLTLHP